MDSSKSKVNEISVVVMVVCQFVICDQGHVLSLCKWIFKVKIALIVVFLLNCCGDFFSPTIEMNKCEVD